MYKWVVGGPRTAGANDMRSAKTTETRGGQRCRLLIALALSCCAVAIAACGSATKPGTATSQSASLVDFAVCMRSHGVPNFPDPGGGDVTLVPTGVNPSAPAFKTAWSACSNLVPQLHPPQQVSTQATDQLLKFAQCLRSHGLTGLPDPTQTRPPSHTGYSAVIRRGGDYLAVPAALLASPAYTQATAACRSVIDG